MALMVLPVTPKGRDWPRFDGDYLERLRQGDPDTEAHFASYFAALLRIKLRSRLPSRQLVEDASQETFLRVFKTLRSGDGARQPENLGAYVNGVCNNVLREIYRAEKRHPQADEPAVPLTAEAPTVEDRMLVAERRALVRRTIDELPERDRRLLRAMFVEDYDKEEVCDKFAVGRDYLRVVLHRAKLRFRARFEERGEVAGGEKHAAANSTG